MAKKITIWLFVGMFQGIVSETRAFRKEDEAIKAFDQYTGLSYRELVKDHEKWTEFQENNDKYTGTTIHEVKLEA